METQTVYRKLPVKLSEEELAKMADELAAKELEKDREEAAKKAANASATGRINNLKERIAQLSKAVDSKEEEREIACDEIWDDDRFEVRIVRKDTGEKIHDRPYSSVERAEATQETLPFEVDLTNGKKGKGTRTLFDEKPVTVGPKDATPAPDELEHNGQKLQRVKRNGAKKGKGRGKAARS